MASAAASVKVGDLAPDFTATDDRDRRISLSDFKGQAVVLFFYPKDDTPGCTVEACAFQEALPTFEGVNAKVIGVSPDPVKKHLKFKEKFGLEYPLVADTDHAVSEAYGVWGEKKFMGRKYMGVNRTTFVIDAKGKIAHVFEGVKPAGHADEVAAVVRGLK